MEALAAMHPAGAAGLVSTRGVRYRELGLGGRQPTAAELAELLAAEPGLFRRPLVTDGRRLVVGFDRAGLAALLVGPDPRPEAP